VVTAGDFRAEIDFAYVPQKIAIELDGFRFHRDWGVFHRDRRRANALTNLGWRVLRFTWPMVTEDPGYIVKTVAEALGLTPLEQLPLLSA
jgi:very-short-patch-repair endonuclease